jgi:hypothetical protein
MSGLDHSAMPLNIFTIATKPSHHLDRLLTSAEAFGIQVDVQGKGRPFLGMGTKRNLMHEYVSACDPDQLVMYVDAYDVIFLANVTEMVSVYERYYKGEVVFGAEQNLGMYTVDDIMYYVKYPIRSQRYKYLNAGTVMGPAGKIKALLDIVGVGAEDAKCDQVDLIRYFTTHSDQLTVDTGHYLFAVNGGRAGLESRDYRIENGRLHSVNTDTWPILLHVPGKFFIGLDAIAKKLGFMGTLPQYSKQELKLYKAATRDHQLCDMLGIENYVLRLIKNWTVNISILVVLIWGVRYLLSFF